MAIFLQIILNGLLVAAIYALISSGLSFLYATSGIFHLAHGVVVLGSGYAFWWAWTVLGWHPILAAILALGTAAAAGFLMNELVYERLRLRGAKGLGYLIATLALLMLGTGLILLLFGGAPKTFPLEPHIFELGGAHLSSTELLIMLVAAALVALFAWITRSTKFGKAMRATADNETVAEVVGIDTKRIRRGAFLAASLLAATAGIFMGLEFNLDPAMGVILAVMGFMAMVIGGPGSVLGAVLASIMIGMLEQGVVWFLSATWRNAITFLLLFLFLLFKPSGFWGMRKS